MEETAHYSRRTLLAGAVVAAGGFAAFSQRVWGASPAEILNTASAIHMEPIFNANRKRVYEALTDAKQFQKVILLSAAGKTMPTDAPVAEISSELGGAFSLFGAYISGRQLELVANELIVQAWHAGSWDKSDFSITKFALKEEGAGTRIVFDHTGFPGDQASHLAQGWHMNYWEPLQKYLATQS